MKRLSVVLQVFALGMGVQFVAWPQKSVTV